MTPTLTAQTSLAPLVRPEFAELSFYHLTSASGGLRRSQITPGYLSFFFFFFKI